MRKPYLCRDCGKELQTARFRCEECHTKRIKPKNVCIDCGKPAFSKRCKECDIKRRYPNRVRPLVVQIRKQSLCLMEKEIAKAVNVSTERVRQILQDEKLPTRHYIKTKPTYICLNCGQLTTHRNGLCSPACTKQYRSVPFYCDNCGKLSYIPQYQLLHRIKDGQNRLYCSRKCFGSWLGREYGKNNLPNEARQSKYKIYFPQIKEALGSGQSFYSILREFHIPLGNMGYIKEKIGTL